MTNKEIRRRALMVLREKPLRLIGLTAMLALPFLAAALWVALVVGLMLFNDLFVLYTDASGAVRMGVTHGLTYGKLIPYITGMSGGVFFVGIVSQGLLTGYMHCMIQLMRGKKPTVRALFSRLDACLKMLGLQLLVLLKALLRVVPLMLLMRVAEMLLPGGVQNEGFLLLMTIAPLALIFWMARLIFSHMLAGYVIADQPEIRIRDSIARSKQAMQGGMWRFFALHAPYLLVTWGITAVAAVVISAAPAAETAISLLTLVLYAIPALLTGLAGAGFYVARCGAAETPEEAPAENEAPMEAAVDDERKE